MHITHFYWLTVTSEMHFVKFHPEVTSCLLSRGKRKYAPLGMRLLWKKNRNYFLVYHLTSHFLLNLQNYKEFEAEILDLQLKKIWTLIWYQKYTTSGWALGDENVIGIRPLNFAYESITREQAGYGMASPVFLSHLCRKIVYPLYNFRDTIGKVHTHQWGH